jgi:hypothetical protein
LTRCAFALSLVALGGCYHVTTSRVGLENMERVEHLPRGMHLALVAKELEPGRIMVTAEERPMCRDEEHGSRSFVNRTVKTKGGPPGSIGILSASGFGPGLGLGAPALAAAGLIVAAPIIVYYVYLPDRIEQDVSTGEPDEPYQRLSDRRKPCRLPARRLPDLEVRMVQRLDETTCLEWRATTSAEGLLALPPSLDRSAARALRCEQPVQEGYLWLEAADDPEVPTDPAEVRPQPRTQGTLVLPLSLQDGSAVPRMPGADG